MTTVKLAYARDRVAAYDSAWVAPSGGNSILAMAAESTTAASGAAPTHSVVLPTGIVTVMLALALHGSTECPGVQRLLGPLQYVATCAPPVRRREDEADGLAVAPAVITARDQIDAVRTALSLGPTELADVIGVSRATIYTWIAGDVSAPKDSATSKQLRWLYSQARKWESISSYQLGTLRHASVTDQGQSVVALLSIGKAAEAQLAAAFDALASRVEGRARQHGVRTPDELAARRDVGRERLDRIRSLGL